MEKINLFIQITKWLKKGIIFYVFAMWFMFSGGMYLVLEYKKSGAADISLFLVMIISVLVTLVVGVLMIPLYKIIHYLGALLGKVRDNQKTNATQLILSSEEFRLLKKYLIIQTLLNLINWLYDSFKEPHPDTENIINNFLNKEGFESVLNVLAYVFEVYEWIFPSFSYSMPLYFLGIVYIVSSIYDEKLKLKSELNEVI